VTTRFLVESIKVGELLRVTAGSREFQARVTSVGQRPAAELKSWHSVCGRSESNARHRRRNAVTAFPVVNAADISALTVLQELFRP